MQYWDSSALVKLYVPEEDTEFFLRLSSAAGSTIHTSLIASVELVCAVLRAEVDGRIGSSAARQLIRQFDRDRESGRVVLREVGEAVREETVRLGETVFHRKPPIMIRSLDLIHVATASVCGATHLVAVDKRLRDVASLLKLKVLP